MWRDQAEALNFSIRTKENKEVFQPAQVTTKARLISKPEPQYTLEARRAQVTGTVVLRAVFGSDGVVKHILILKALRGGLTERAVQAARGIKFVPATLDGKPGSMWLQLEYNFSLY
jgi:protein TonB